MLTKAFNNVISIDAMGNYKVYNYKTGAIKSENKLKIKNHEISSIITDISGRLLVTGNLYLILNKDLFTLTQ